MKNIIGKVLEIILDKKPILKELNIQCNIGKYPEGAFFDPSKSNPPYAHLTVKHPKKKSKTQLYDYVITLYSNMFEYFGEYVYKDSNEDVVEYLDALGVEFNDKSLLVYNLLHELGHVYLYESFRVDSGSYEKLLSLDKINEEALGLVFGNLSLDEVYGKYHFHELNAEKFATFYFPVVWKSIQ